jgi:hypothetical protein
MLLNLSDNCLEQAQFNIIVLAQKIVDRVGFEPTTSTMPTNFHSEIAMKKESIMFESHPFHYLSDFYDLA